MMIFWTSCELPDNTEVYKQGLVVFGSINMLEITDNFIQSEINAIHVSMSSAIDNNIDNANDLYINDAEVTISGPLNIDATDNFVTLEYSDSLPGVYYPSRDDYYIFSNSTYILNVKYTNSDSGEYYEVNASTTTPEKISIKSIAYQDSYLCEECSDPSIFGETNCENQGETWITELVDIDSINVNNFSTINEQTFGSWWNDENQECNCELLDDYIQDSIISTINLSRFGCSVGSFASLPYFILDFQDSLQDFSSIKILSHSLEPFKMGNEPYEDLDENGEYDDGEPFFDYNENEEHDETFINTFYDTTLVFNLWKGPYFRDDLGNPYLETPFVWTVETVPTPIMWLYFNQYGKHLMVVQSSDNAYFDYLSGDPLGQNQYLLPNTNIQPVDSNQGAYGLFSSNYSKPFFLNINKAD